MVTRKFIFIVICAHYSCVAFWLSTVRVTAIYDVIFGDLVKGIWSDLELRMFIPI